MMSRGARQPKQQNGWVGSKREAQGGDDGSSDTGWGLTAFPHLELDFLPAGKTDTHFFQFGSQRKSKSDAFIGVVLSSLSTSTVPSRPLSLHKTWSSRT